MSVFKCSECGCKENTATSRFRVFVSEDKPALCSECDPVIGKWHNRFKKQPFTEPFNPNAHGCIPLKYQHT